MRTLVRKITAVVGIVFIILAVVVLISFVNHKIKLSKEDELFIPNGAMVEVNGHGMHVYTEGSGDNTLVFLSGGGTSSPVLDFKSLYSLLSDEYKTAVVEKSGYGFSEDAEVSRDIDTILSETREALAQAGIEPPYILAPHSMSGIEALYWAQRHPEEVKGIIGLDMAVPQAYEDYPINLLVLKASSLGADVGITRFFPTIVNDSAAIKDGTLSNEDKELYKAIFYRRTLTKSMFREIEEIKTNAKIVEENGIPDIPMFLFISNGEGTGWEKDAWIEMQGAYVESLNVGDSLNLNTDHYLHNTETIKIAEETRNFIEDIINRD